MKVNKIFIFLTIILYIIIFEINLPASIIFLKDGKKIEGDIVFEDDEKITLQEYDTNRTFILQKVEIEKIKYEKKAKPKMIAVTETTGYKTKPILSLAPVFSIPLGSNSSILGSGYGADITLSFYIPSSFLEDKNFYLRACISSGLLFYTSKDPDATASVYLIPAVFYAEVSYTFENALRPYFRLGPGITYSSLTGESEKTGAVQTSSLDTTLAAHLGVAYTYKNTPKVEFYIDSGFLMLFEKINGSFVNVSVGASYKFFDVEL